MISDAARQIVQISVALVVVYMFAAFLILVLEHDTEGALIDTYPKALWYALVTVSTVGYGDLYPITSMGRVVGGVVIIMSIGFIGFVVSKIGELAAEHSRRRFLGMDGTNFTGHYIVIGWNDIGRIVINEMLSAGFRVAVLSHEEKDITEMKLIYSDPATFFATLGITGDSAAFQRLNIDDAVGAILLTGDDATTLVTVLELKQARPDLKITAYVQNSQLKKTVENAGVSYVIAPNELVGRMIASATFEPDVSNFLEDILATTTGEDDLDLQEFRLLETHELAGATFEYAARKLEEKTEARLLCFSRRNGSTWQITKCRLASEILQSDDYLILLADHGASRKLTEYLGVPQGRRM